MKKKALAILLALAMTIAFVVPAFAASGVSATATATVDKNNNVTITVTDNGEKITEVFPNGFVKNGATTFYFTEEEYAVKVEFNGNGVKNVTVVVVPDPSPRPEEDSALPNNGDNDGQPNLYGAITLDQYNNANFHCNANGNGRVWTTLGKKTTQKLSVPLHFVANTGEAVSNQANAETAWHLVHENVYICEECGSAEWVTYSNNSGLPDGKNIQMNHPGQYIEIVKVWLDADGNPIKDTKGLSATFTVSWVGKDGFERSKEVGPGKHFFANDLIESGNITISENGVTRNYTLVEINGEPVIGVVAPVGLNADLSVSFTNKEDPYAIIQKEWAMGDEDNYVGGSIIVDEVEVIAKFDIYNENGECVKEGLLAGEKFYTAPGTYTIVEQPKEGFAEQSSKEVTVGENGFATVTFVNEPIPDYFGAISIPKLVDGKDITLWLQENFDEDTYDDIFADMNFKLYKTSGANTDEEDWKFVGESGLSFDGALSFTIEESGWYVLVEDMGVLAASIFTAPEPLFLEIEVDKTNPDMYTNTVILQSTGGNKAVLFGEGETAQTFDRDALYTVDYYGAPGRSLGIAGLNGYGEIFSMFVSTTKGSNEYPTFCANGGSKRFAGDNDIGCSGYLVAQNDKLDVYDAFVSAYNYIEDNYGKLVDYRWLTQVITWVLLGESSDHGGVSIDAVRAATNLSEDEINAIEDVYANYQGYKGKGKIVDLVYLLCENEEHTFEYCQPQIVPLYGGKVAFENVTIPGFYGSIDAQIDITGEREVITYDYRWIPGTPTIGDTLVAQGGAMDSRGFTINEVSIEEGGHFEVAYSGNNGANSNAGIGVFYDVKVVGNEIIITFDENFISSELTFKAYASKPSGDFDNSHHELNATGIVVIDLPEDADGTFWLFFHSRRLTYYDGSGKYERFEDNRYSEQVDYTGTFTLEVIDAEGAVQFTFTGTLEDLREAAFYDPFENVISIGADFPAGVYTATLSSDDFDTQILTGEIINNGDMIHFIFAAITVTYPDFVIDPGEPA